MRCLTQPYSLNLTLTLAPPLAPALTLVLTRCIQLGYVANHDDPAVHGALSVRRRAAAYPYLYP